MTDTLIEPAPRRIEVPYETDSGLGPTHLGFVVTSNDQTLTAETRTMLTLPGVALFEAKLLSARPRNSELTMTGLAELGDRIVDAVRQINTFRAPDVVALGCTSGAMAIGPDAVTRRVREVFPGVAVTDPLTGALAGLRRLGARRIGFIAPYPRSVADPMIAALRAAGLEVPVAAAFHRETSLVIGDAAYITPESIAAGLREIGAATDIDAVFLACTQMRASAVIEASESAIGKPIVTSNQALCWHALRLSGAAAVVPGFGRLFRLGLSEVNNG